jgi:uncharacterized protein YodC (DUF2158 family)
MFKLGEVVTLASGGRTPMTVTARKDTVDGAVCTVEWEMSPGRIERREWPEAALVAFVAPKA